MRFISSLIIVLSVLLFDTVLEQLFASRHIQNQRIAVVEKLGLLRAQLEGSLNANLHLLNGVSAYISINPDITPTEFNTLAAKLMENKHQLRNIAAAPDLVIRYIYPLEGNQAALGLDYTKNPQQRAAALQARDLNTIVVAGPLNLAQGGVGLIARLPVFYDDKSGQRQFWGMISSVLDSNKLFDQTGISSRPLGLAIAIRGKDSKGSEGEVFFGNPNLFNTPSTLLQVNLPYGFWQMAARPQQGWDTQSPYSWYIRLIFLTLGLIMLYASHLRRRQLAHERLNQATFFNAFEESPLGTAITDPANGNVLNINRSLRQMAGIADPQLDELSKPPESQLPESILALLHRAQINHGQNAQIQDGLGDKKQWLCFRSELQTPDGIRLLTVFQDITERSQLLNQLRLSKLVIDHTSDAVIITNAEAKIIETNPAFSRITGYSRNEALGNTPRLYRSDHHDAGFYIELWQQLNRDGHWRGEIWNRKKDGSLFPAWVSINRVGELEDEQRQYIGVFSDISNIKQVEKELERIAYYDPLTGLPNRALFHDRLQHELATARRHKHQLALLFLDLDRFKYVNDSFGHSVGDALLKIIAERLSSEVRENDTVTRLGGDEFTVIISESAHIGHTTQLVKRILARINQPINLAGQQLHVSASIGIALYPDDGDNSETLIQHADMAMYQAKAQGRNAFHYFTDILHQRASSRLLLENELREALEKNQFVLYYQPKLELNSRRVVGMEALVRWVHPEKGIISPLAFIPVAEESGLIIPLGQWVLEEACRQTELWHQQGWSHLRVAVNLSARQFKKVGLVDDISLTLQQSGLKPSALELEITESMVVEDGSAAVKVLTQLRSLGVEISIDDFGTGYSNLRYLKQFPLNSLKIDRGFVGEITVDREDAAIVKAIILMARGLGLNVIAEGIETQEQLDFLLLHQCSMGQGFLFSPPIAADQFIEWIDRADLDVDLEPSS